MDSEMEAICDGLPTAFAESLDCPVLATAVAMAESKGLADVFGVLAEPKDAKAPEPKPKALEAPLVGETSALPGVLLKGLALLVGVSPPWRLEKEALRFDGSPLVA